MEKIHRGSIKTHRGSIKKQTEKYKKIYGNNKSSTALKSQVHLNNFDKKIVNKLYNIFKNCSLTKISLDKMALLLFFDHITIIASLKILKRKLILNRFFKQCPLIFDNRYSILSYINYTNEKRLSTFSLPLKDIGKIIQNLDSNKAHTHEIFKMIIFNKMFNFF